MPNQQKPNQLTLDTIFGDPDINGGAPMSLKFSPNGEYVSYLKPDDNNANVLNLWAYNIQSQAHEMLVESKAIVPDERTLSDAEKARRERLRISHTGIVEYYWSPTSRALLFPIAGDLYLYALDTDSPLTQLTSGDTFETHMKFSPDGQYLGFVRNQNLFVVELETGMEIQLTNDGAGPISNGLPEFIAQEEMHRYDGYWWSPDSQSIAFIRVDESPIVISQRYEIDADHFGVFDQHYPYAGTPNAAVTVAITKVSKPDIQFVPLSEDPESYLARINWFSDSKRLAIQIQRRDQQTLDLKCWDRDTNQISLLLTETSDSWINLHNNFYSLPDGQGFIWCSERSGFSHLYLCQEDGTIDRQLTTGKWVVDDLIAVKAGDIYFTGYADTPLECHLYRTSLADVSEVQRVTTAGQTHSVSMNPHSSYYIDRASSAMEPPSVSLQTLNGDPPIHLYANSLVEGHPFYPYARQRGAVSFGTLSADDGQALHYRLIEPVNRKPGVQYPVIVTVYGGPGVQRVTNDWIPPWHHYMAQRGYGLLQLDNRGSTHRGKAFESPIYLKMGDVEVRDQLMGVKFLQQLDWVDASRLGVFGHSYGGYMTLMLMMKSDVFAAGVSVAPVTDWRLYDTHYTERYLGHPDDNSPGYKDSEVFPYVKDLTGELLVIHGMADDNVLFTNTTRLYKALQDQNIMFETMTYPGAKHGLTGRSTNIHRYATMDKFFDKFLTPGELS